MLKTFKLGGVHPAENKISEDKKIEVLPLPKIAYIPISQHLGAPAKPLVNKGDSIKVGQQIAKGEAFISANIHSSVSGKVQKIDAVIDASGYKRTAVVVQVEGDEWEEGIDKTKDIKRISPFHKRRSSLKSTKKESLVWVELLFLHMLS